MQSDAEKAAIVRGEAELLRQSKENIAQEVKKINDILEHLNKYMDLSEKNSYFRTYVELICPIMEESLPDACNGMCQQIIMTAARMDK